MARIAYVNGQFVRIDKPAIHIEDRGFQFADGIYEVCLVVDGVLWDAEGHFKRWERSLNELAMDEPIASSAIAFVMRRLLRLNRLKNALIYMQGTRGVAPRDHAFPSLTVEPSFVMTAKPFNISKSNAAAEKGVSIITREDIRWGRVDIKSISLLPNVLAKDDAKQEGAAEAWLHKNGVVTEGASSNAWIVTTDGKLVTHPTGTSILGGITRATVKQCAEKLGHMVEERPFTIEEAMTAKEAFLTAATALVTPVTEIDGQPVANGGVGEVSHQLRDAYVAHCMRHGRNA